MWSGGQSFLFGGNLPSENWLHACLAFVHVRNRLPTSKWPARTPYDVMHALDGDNASMAEQVKRFRRLGSLCFVAVPHNILRQNGKNGRKSYRAMFLGYADQDGQKGYKVQRLQDGKVLTIAHAQLFKCHENRLVFERDESYDAWLRKKQKSIASKSMMDDVSDDSLSMISESDSESDDSETSRSEQDSENVNSSEEVNVIDSASMSRALDSDDEDDDDDVIARLERGETLTASESPPRTRNQMPVLEVSDEPEAATQGETHEHKYQHLNSESEEDEHDVNDDAGTRSDGENMYELEGIDAFRRVGKKRGGMEYRALWKGGESSWEPRRSFRQHEPQAKPDDPLSYLPMFEDFREKIARGEVEEYKEGEEDTLSESTIEAIAKRISMLETLDKRKKVRVLKAVIKQGMVIPESRNEARKSKHWQKFLLAESEELESFREHDVWELVDLPVGRKAVGTRWVYDIKVDVYGNVTRHKARLVAQGYSQRKGIDYNETFAPTMHIKTARALLAIAARNNLMVKQYDVSTAFLHASLREEVYVKQPPGHEIKGKEHNGLVLLTSLNTTLPLLLTSLH